MRNNTRTPSRRSKQDDASLLPVVGILTSAAGIVYAAAVLIGGEFLDFYESALIWILYGICLAGCLVYLDRKQHK